MDRQAAFIAIGDKAKNEARIAGDVLRTHSPVDVTIVTDCPPNMTPKQASRKAKTTLLDWTQGETVAYMDADTRTQADISAAFEAIESGFDLCICPSTNQGSEAFWHIAESERNDTAKRYGFMPLQLQCGVMFVGRNERTQSLFSAWYDEWAATMDEDQAAFMRALRDNPVRLWLLGYPWNGGAVVAHRFGACR